MKPQPVRRAVRDTLGPLLNELGFKHVPSAIKITDYRRDREGHTQHIGFDRPKGVDLRILLSRDMPPQDPRQLEGSDPVDADGPWYYYETQEELQVELQACGDFISGSAMLWLTDPYAHGYLYWCRTANIITHDIRSSEVVVTWRSGVPANAELVAIKNLVGGFADRPILQLRSDLLRTSEYRSPLLPHSQAIDFLEKAIQAGLQASIVGA